MRLSSEHGLLAGRNASKIRVHLQHVIGEKFLGCVYVNGEKMMDFTVVNTVNVFPT
jgi:hypothetical protein